MGPVWHRPGRHRHGELGVLENLLGRLLEGLALGVGHLVLVARVRVQPAGFLQVPNLFENLNRRDGAVVAGVWARKVKKELLVRADNDNQPVIADPEAFFLFDILNVAEREDELGARAREGEEAPEAKVVVADVDLAVRRQDPEQVAKVRGLQRLRLGEQKVLAEAHVGRRRRLVGHFVAVVGPKAGRLVVMPPRAVPHARHLFHVSHRLGGNHARHLAAGPVEVLAKGADALEGKGAHLLDAFERGRRRALSLPAVRHFPAGGRGAGTSRSARQVEVGRPLGDGGPGVEKVAGAEYLAGRRLLGRRGGRVLDREHVRVGRRLHGGPLVAAPAAALAEGTAITKTPPGRVVPRQTREVHAPPVDALQDVQAPPAHLAARSRTQSGGDQGGERRLDGAVVPDAAHVAGRVPRLAHLVALSWLGVLDHYLEDVYSSLAGGKEGKKVLVDSVRLVVVNDTYLTRLCALDHVRLLNVDNVLHGQRDLDAVAVVVGAEYDPLQHLDPVAGAGLAVGAKVVGPLGGDNVKVQAVVVVGNRRRDAVAEVDVADGKVERGRVGVVRQDVALELKVVAVEARGSLAALGQVAGAGDEFLRALVNTQSGMD